MRKQEFLHISVAAIALALAFTIARFSVNIFGTSMNEIVIIFLMSFITVSIGFIFHELGHRLVAKRFGYAAEFKIWPVGIILALGVSFFGFVFAAPGAVMIYSKRIENMKIAIKKYGLISLSGPLTNVILAAAFLAMNLFSPSQLFELGFSINVFLALFNSLPVPPLDGSKIFAWNKGIWAALFVVLIVLFTFIRF
ncbi:MAG: site-2 protease family protein [Candidatus Aenigmatarchaeota archaeon]